MDASAKKELDSIKRELDSIIRELESISKGVRNDFKGIGNDKCADCIDRVLDQYYVVRKKLKNIDTNTLTEAFAKSYGGGGRSW